jgi:hypothetical protein
MPIASFYGPEAEHDAKLFTAACELYETNHALSMMLAAFAQTVELVTEGQIDLAADTDYTRLMAAARLARMQATGVEVVEVSGTSTKRHNAEAFDRCRMPIREAFGLTLREDIKITRVSRVGRQDALVANELTT